MKQSGWEEDRPRIPVTRAAGISRLEAGALGAACGANLAQREHAVRLEHAGAGSEIVFPDPIHNRSLVLSERIPQTIRRDSAGRRRRGGLEGN